jgi:hypothetical protein
MLAMVTVDTDMDVVDAADGRTSLREAIAATNDTMPGPDEIVFDFGHDGPATILLTKGALRITDSLSINGPGAELLTIDASGSDITPDIDDGKGSSIFFIDDPVTVRGLTLTGGDAIGGGAILARATLTVTASTISGNSADFGGGIRAFGDVMVISSTISGNSAIFLEGRGGGIHADGNVTVISSTISGNSAQFGGGGIGAVGNVTVTSSTISGNSATGVEGVGGGIYTPETVTITSSTIAGNSAELLGGGIAGGSVTVISSTISGNSAQLLGGGIRAVRDVAVTSSTISGNSVIRFDGRGGGIASFAVMVTCSTISGNSASDSGGIAPYIGAVTIKNSIIAGNTDDGRAPDLRRRGNILFSVEYSLIGDNRGTGLAEAPVGIPDAKGNLIGGPIHGVIDPKLNPLANNGGPTFTHALLPGSPANNAGNLNAVAGMDGVPEFDQRGMPFGRVVNGRIDIGAVEYQQPSDLNLLVDTLIDEADGNHARGDLSLREAIALTNTYPSVDTIRFDPALAGGTILLTKGELPITDILTIDGLGAELLTIDASGNDPTPDIDDGKGSRIFLIHDGNEFIDNPVTVRGLMLTGGDSSGGGGAVFSGESFTIIGSTITGNHSLGHPDIGGGAIFALGNLTITASTLAGNSVRFSIGGAVLAFGDVTINFSTISGNSDGSSSRGGIYTLRDLVISSSTVFNNYGTGIAARNATVINCTISGNRGSGISARYNATVFGSTISGNNGGGIGANKVAVRDSTISGNMADFGGAISASDVTVIGSVISGNSAATAGGGISATGVVTISSSTIIGNSAQFTGGGIGTFGNVVVTSSTISENKANEDGGIRSGSATVTFSTISGNLGGGISGNTLTLKNSIVAGNGGNMFAADLHHVPINGPLSVEYSLVGDKTGTSLAEAPVGMPDANGNLIGGPIHGVIDPKLGPLANNGGPTLTHAPLPGSPAVNAGNPNAVAGVNGVPMHDQRGAPFGRIAGGAIDMGAVESQSIPPAMFGDYNLDGAVDALDYIIWRATLGDSLTAGRGADGSGNGRVDQADYDLWRRNYGRTLPAGSPAIASAAFIEPVGEVAGAMDEADVRFSADWDDESRSNGRAGVALDRAPTAHRHLHLLLVLNAEHDDRKAVSTDALDAAFDDDFQVMDLAAVSDFAGQILDGLELLP